MSRRRGLTPEDRELWSRVAKTATPLHPQARHQPEDAPASTPTPSLQPRPAPGFELPPKLRIGGKALPKRAHDLAPSPADKMRAAPLRMDHKTHKQMTRGKMRPEARLDLHGMTLAQAGPELVRFVLSCHAQGLRLVLVITGKGSRADDEGPLPTRPGALRHQVPHWLHTAPLAAVVQQVAPAHLRHGGTGAYYVYLRR
ncbi:Smr/MutS family protein [Paracoccus xiamenensis]|uniref:Smr/MutS family protein n=1 Tax=Paracoccus xiamenensis TaxID=2714901 RepID=UPI0014079ADC|nr:Smr/MutS family protein [Paracoccus xiamenensis]NHF72967.1 DNA mismatch repair protein MutS [Paracoccus xiamenensis]